jgi:hypothetical protein
MPVLHGFYACANTSSNSMIYRLNYGKTGNPFRSVLQSWKLALPRKTGENLAGVSGCLFTKYKTLEFCDARTVSRNQ